MNLHLLRDFAEAYRLLEVEHHGDASVIRLAKAAMALGAMCLELQHFTRAQAMLDELNGPLAIEDRPMIERLRLNAAVRFARKLALLPPTEKT